MKVFRMIMGTGMSICGGITVGFLMAKNLYMGLILLTLTILFGVFYLAGWIVETK